ncbi:MAG: AI-2E family transporter [Desulfobacteraceae bacterium]|jgi:predicted PurR-regulated permease PerM|nr:AI-2E family transporter [Desulfobacteraceae bacterium]
MQRHTVNNLVLMILVFLISALFLSMIRQFLMAILLAGIFSAMARPVYQRLNQLFGHRPALASAATLVLLVLLVLIPLGGLLGIVTAQAIKVGQSATPWVQQQINEPAGLWELLRHLPFHDQLADLLLPYRETILRKAGELVASLSRFLIGSLGSATVVTVNILFMLFVLLYTMFFFLIDGERLLGKILYYLPLEDKDERRMLDKFTSVTRATLKGTAVIGVIQGTSAGAAFAVVGIPSAVFWGTVMAVLSFIPGIGSALVWVPATLILIASGDWGRGLALGAWCAVVVGSVDNFLRPQLVGKDTQMHELMILFSTLGGIAMFGVLGVIIGPIIAALFVKVWEIYGVVFADLLPGVGPSEPHPSPPQEYSQPKS